MHQNGAEYRADQHHRDAHHRAESRQCVGRVDLIAQRQADEHDATVLDLPGPCLLVPRQRDNTPWRLRGLHDGMIRGAACGDVHHRTCREWLSKSDAVDAAVGRQAWFRNHSVTEHGHRSGTRAFVFAVAHLHVIRVHEAAPVIAGVAAERVHAVENQLGLVDQLRIGLLQQIIAHQRTYGKGDADGADGQQHDDAGDQFRTQRNRLNPAGETAPYLVLLRQRPGRLHGGRNGRRIGGVARGRRIGILAHG